MCYLLVHPFSCLLLATELPLLLSPAKCQLDQLQIPFEYRGCDDVDLMHIPWALTEEHGSMRKCTVNGGKLKYSEITLSDIFLT